MKITYFVHSITEDNEKKLATGWLPGELSAEGVKRAENLSYDLKNKQFDAVFCSDLKRAMHSTEIFFDGRFPVFIDWRLRECNYGDYDGKPAADFKKDREQMYIQKSYPSGESYQDVETRVKNFLNEVSLLFPDGNIAIVAHQAPQLALDVIIKQKTWNKAIEEDWRKTGAWKPGWIYEIR